MDPPHAAEGSAEETSDELYYEVYTEGEEDDESGDGEEEEEEEDDEELSEGAEGEPGEGAPQRSEARQVISLRWLLQTHPRTPAFTWHRRALLLLCRRPSTLT